MYALYFLTLQLNTPQETKLKGQNLDVAGSSKPVVSKMEVGTPWGEGGYWTITGGVAW